MREVRKLGSDGHQTSIVSTNRILSIQYIASYMFARWAQENFFRYMRQEYALDKIIQYSVEEISSDIRIVNPEYNNIGYRIKKEREKLGRRKAKLYEYDRQNPLSLPEKEDQKWMKFKLELLDDIRILEKQVEDMVAKRKYSTKYRLVKCLNLSGITA